MIAGENAQSAASTLISVNISKTMKNIATQNPPIKLPTIARLILRFSFITFVSENFLNSYTEGVG